MGEGELNGRAVIFVTEIWSSAMGELVNGISIGLRGIHSTSLQEFASPPGCHLVQRLEERLSGNESIPKSTPVLTHERSSSVRVHAVDGNCLSTAFE